MSVKTIELYPAQHDFVTSHARFSAFIAGIGSGKSYAGAVKSLIKAKETKGLGLIIAPTYPMLRDATLRTFQSVAGDALVKFHKSEMIATLRGGMDVLFRSSDMPDRLRGPNISYCWIDEAALCPKGTWEIAIGRLREGGRAGPCWLTGTPKGRNWVYDLLPRLTVFRAATKDNPYLDHEFVRSLEIAYTGKFAAQELSGDFVSFEGLVYDEFDRSRHVVVKSGPWAQVIAGCDEGYTNPSVLLVIGLDGDGRAHILSEFYQRRVVQGDVIAEAHRLSDLYRIQRFYCDPSAAGLIAEMGVMGLPMAPADHRVQDGIQHVKGRLALAGDGRPRLTVDPTCVNTIAELESYSWKEGKTGTKDEPEKVNDHAMDAARYALVTHTVTSGPLLLWSEDDDDGN